ncbi:MAG TPA: hypothetical protein ENF47_02855 [Thermoprotei archaeon]|nr:hypothetical protein [Thermoprotei archaeon]
MSNDSESHSELLSRIEIVDVYSIEPHEEYIPEILEKLVHDIMVSKVLKDPILADVNRGFVIDGTHRLLALRKLNIRYIPVLNLDYLKEKILLGRWFRGFNNPDVLKIIEKNFDVRQINKFDIGYIDKLSLSIIYNKCIYEIPLGEWYVSLKNIDRLLKSFRPDFIADSLIHEKIDEYISIICYRKISRNEILNIFNRGFKFSYKTTRHIPSYRILGINMPIKYLMEDKDRCYSYLRGFKLRNVGRGVYIDNRYYEEEVYIAFK